MEFFLPPGAIHDGHPVARWCVSNAVADVDGNGNLKPSKKRSTERIDFVSALVTALARALVLVVTRSVYDRHRQRQAGRELRAKMLPEFSVCPEWRVADRMAGHTPKRRPGGVRPKSNGRGLRDSASVTSRVP